jgi:hypothetical protein
MSFLSSLISPKLAIGTIRSQLEKNLNKEVPCFDVGFVGAVDKLYFIIEGVRYEFPNSVIKALIKNQAQKYVKKNQTFDACLLSINDKDEINAKIYYTEDGKKLILNQKI